MFVLNYLYSWVLTQAPTDRIISQLGQLIKENYYFK